MQKGTKVTARTIAAACDTSLSAVTRAFKPDASISSVLRAAILREAAKQGYLPPDKRTRLTKRSVSIGLVIGDIESPFYPHVMARIAKAAAQFGWELMTFVVPDDGTPDDVLGQVLRANVDVVVLASADLSSNLATTCRERALPVIHFNRVQIDTEMTAICTDNYGGGALAGQRLLSTGRKTIAFVGGRKETSTHLERRRGLIDTLEAKGAALAYDTIGNFDYQTSLEIGRELFTNAAPPDGVFCANDYMGFALIDAAHEVGLRPGSDVSILGYDDVPMAGWHRYQLTTISQQAAVMVDRTVGVIQRIANRDIPASLVEVVPAKLIIRQSG